jgi:hypothetical protein
LAAKEMMYQRLGSLVLFVCISGAYESTGHKPEEKGVNVPVMAACTIQIPAKRSQNRHRCRVLPQTCFLGLISKQMGMGICGYYLRFLAQMQMAL